MTRTRSSRLASAVSLLVLPVMLLSPMAATGHSPDPVLSGALWGQDQSLKFRWRAGEEPPGVMQTAIRAAATASNGSDRSRAGVYAYDTAGSSWINYGLNVGCGVNGIACFSRVNAPTSFTMSFREQGHWFDWGQLRWCQFYASPPDGCFDAQNIALDEFGHVEILGHHVNYADDSDFRDAVVQTVSRAKPRAGWDVHSYGRCDVASLQREYDTPTAGTKISTCLDLATTLSISPSSTWLTWGASVTLSSSLRIAVADAYDRLSGNALGSRTVTLQRRPVGSTVWTTVATMAAGSTAATYAYTATGQKQSADWRAVFAGPADEGLDGATSAIVRVSVSSCTTAPCPESAPRDSLR
jgi:hypothetical protein